MTPEQALTALKEGNERFVNGRTLNRGFLMAQVRTMASGQFPFAVVLGCMDSRVPPELVLDQGIGNIFTLRIAGNFENTDILGSMEFATKMSSAKLILVMGHENCGAIKAAIDGVELGNISTMLENVKRAVDLLSDYEGDQTNNNPDFVHRVTEKNVRLTMDHIRERSPILKEMEDQGQIKIAGALYDVKTGAIEFLG